MLNSLNIEWLLSLLLRTQDFLPTSLLSIILIQCFSLPSSKTKNKKAEKQGGNTTATLRTTHFLVFQHIFPSDLPYRKADDTCITPLWHIVVTFCQTQSGLEAILKVIWTGSVMHQSIPAVPIPPGQTRGICSNVSHGGGAWAILSQPGGWALAYPGATPGHLTHMFLN